MARLVTFLSGYATLSLIQTHFAMGLRIRMLAKGEGAETQTQKVGNPSGPNLKVLNAAIDACAKGGQRERALDLLEHMQETPDTCPDVTSYNAAIGACVKSGQWKTALELLQEMKNAGIRPNVTSYSPAIDVCAKSGQWEIGLQLFDEMQEAGSTPDVTS